VHRHDLRNVRSLDDLPMMAVLVGDLSVQGTVVIAVIVVCVTVAFCTVVNRQ